MERKNNRANKTEDRYFGGGLVECTMIFTRLILYDFMLIILYAHPFKWLKVYAFAREMGWGEGEFVLLTS